MKKGNNKAHTANKKTAAGLKKASYIGAGLAVGISLAGLVLAWRLSDMTLPSEGNISVPLPTAPPVMTVQPSAPATVVPPAVTETPIAAKEPVEETIAVAAKPEILRIILPIESEVMTVFSMEELILSKTLGDWRVHTGIDLRADSGTEVKAAAAGVVERAYQDPQMGYTIVISHGTVYKTIYQNLASVEMVTEGQQIEQGQGIAAVGNSAAAELLEDAHLHFAVLAGESYQNPLDFVQEN